MKNILLRVDDLHTTFKTDKGEVQAVNGLSFDLHAGEILGIVGESGSGKSVTAYSIMQILADNGSVKSGKVLYKGANHQHFAQPSQGSYPAIQSQHR